MDITLQIMLNPADHDLSYDPAKEARRYKRGDIVGVYKREQVGNPDNQRFAFVHIDGVPDGADPEARFQKIKDTLTGPLMDNTDPEAPVIDRRRWWRIPRSVLPAGVRDTLLTEKQITVSWAVVKPYIRKKVMTNKLDPSLDVETTELTDTDIT